MRSRCWCRRNNGAQQRGLDQWYGQEINDSVRLDGKKVDGKNIEHKRAEVDDEAAAAEADYDIDDATERNNAFCNDGIAHAEKRRARKLSKAS